MNKDVKYPKLSQFFMKVCMAGGLISEIIRLLFF